MWSTLGLELDVAGIGNSAAGKLRSSPLCTGIAGEFEVDSSGASSDAIPAGKATQPQKGIERLSSKNSSQNGRA